MKSLISIVNAGTFEYPFIENSYRPDVEFEELKVLQYGISSQKNPVYSAVRESLHLLKLDEEHYGTELWNPLKGIIKSGDVVLIKPNLVLHKNHNKEQGELCLYTQPSVVAPIIDYIILALGGKGKIVLGDAPMQECDFQYLIEKSGYKKMVEFYQKRNIDISLVDFREMMSVVKDGIHYNYYNEEAKGKVVDLGKDSEFASVSSDTMKRMRVTNYDPRIMNLHHNENKHEYFISQYLLDADVVINMPKPKTHRKGGVTISLKNLVGINTRKEFLPHHTRGAKGISGDEFEKKSIIHDLRSDLIDKKNIYVAEHKYFMAKCIRPCIKICSVYLKLVRTPNSEGSWYGNDTISRTIVDLNKIILYADKNGKIQNAPARKCLIVADMIISGEKEGPVAPTAKKVGYIVAGMNGVCFDETVATIMGFDYKKIPTLKRGRMVQGDLKVVHEEIPVIVSNMPQYHEKQGTSIEKTMTLMFEATEGWKGHIEL